jgi:hypothetical protein
LGTSGAKFLQDMLQFTAIGHGTFTSTIGAFTGLGGTTGVPNGIAVTVNDAGAFFNATDGAGGTFLVGTRQYTGGSLRAQTAILIHEVGHGITAAGFQKDNGIPKAGKSNDKLVDQYCRVLIEGIQ